VCSSDLEGFTFEMSNSQSISIMLQDREEEPVPGVLFYVYSAPLDQGGLLIGNGTTNDAGIFKLDFELPENKTAVYAYTYYEPFEMAQRIPIAEDHTEYIWGANPPPAENATYRLAEVQNSFNCQTGLYQSIGNKLKKLNITTGTYVTVTSAPDNFNAIGYNTQNNLIYGIRKSGSNYKLWELDAEGNVNDLGTVSGITSGGFHYTGDFDDQGNLTLAGKIGNEWTLLAIDVDQAPNRTTARTLRAMGDVGNLHDITFNAVYDKFYSMDIDGNLVMIDPTNLTIQRLGDFFDIAGRGAFGAVWSDSNGDIYFSQNTTGNIFKTTLNNQGQPTRTTFVMQGEPTGNNDGASCVQAASPFIDSDDDGVFDDVDAFPNDPTKTYVSYVPAQGAQGTYAFEDRWPEIGDYDFNDLVMDYNYEYLRNRINQTARIVFNLKVRTVGAAYQLGFGISFDDIQPSNIIDVRGTQTTSISTNFAGVENNQSKAVIIAFENVHELMGHTPGVFINVGKGRSAEEYNMTVTIDLARAVDNVGIVNPFIFTRGNRSREIHFKGYEPTDLANRGDFGTFDDASSGKNTYTTAQGMPWALNFPETFTPMQETTNILEGYPNFRSWVISNGSQNLDWYKLTHSRQDKLYIRTSETPK